MYSNVVLNIFNNPKNAGRIKKPDGIADLFNEEKTAHVEFSLRIESGIITNCQFRAQANPYIVAICSTITQMLKGKMISMVFLDPYSIKKELGDESDFNIDFCIDCVKMAVDDYKEKLEKGNKNKKQDDEYDDETESDVQPKEVEVELTATEPTLAQQNDDDDDFSDFFDFLDED
mgnify:CR=1 FL=1